jgi:hypothetical protein
MVTRRPGESPPRRAFASSELFYLEDPVNRACPADIGDPGHPARKPVDVLRLAHRRGSRFAFRLVSTLCSVTETQVRPLQRLSVPSPAGRASLVRRAKLLAYCYGYKGARSKAARMTRRRGGGVVVTPPSANESYEQASGGATGIVWFAVPLGVTKVTMTSKPSSRETARWTCPKPGSIKPVPAWYQVVTHSPFCSSW